MKIFVICSKHIYPAVPAIVEELEKQGHSVTLPNAYTDPGTEERHKAKGAAQHATWKKSMLTLSQEKIAEVEAVLVLNMEKNGVSNYIGGATFLEMYDAFRLGKKIFLYNSAPEGMLYDEICGMQPMVLNGVVAHIEQ